MRNKSINVVPTDVQDDTNVSLPSRKRFKLKNMFRSHRFIPYFQDKGLTVQDLPKAIICHEFMGYCMLGMTWIACYHFPISEIPCLKAPMSRVMSLVPKVLSDPVAANPFLCSKYGKSYMESACFRKLLRPITLPGKLYLTYKMVQIIPDIKLPTFCATPTSPITAPTTVTEKENNTNNIATSKRWKIFQRRSVLPNPTSLSMRGGASAVEVERDYCSYKDPSNTDSNKDSSAELEDSEYIDFKKIGEKYRELGLKYKAVTSTHLHC